MNLQECVVYVKNITAYLRFFIVPMGHSESVRASEIRVFSYVNIVFLYCNGHVFVFFLCILEICKLYSDMQKSGLDILSTYSVLTLRPH